MRRRLPVRLVLAYFDSGTPNYAAGLAFNAFLAMFPIVLGLFSILGFVLHDATVYRSVEAVVVQAFPADAQRPIRQVLRDAQNNAGTIAAVSVVGLLYSGTALFASLEFALNQIYGVRGRHPIRQRIIGLQLIAVFGVAIVFAVALNAAVAFIDGQLLNAAAYLNVVAGWLVITYLLFWIYRYVPNVRLSAREVTAGAAAAGLLIELLTLAFPFLFDLTHRASPYTRTFTLLLVLMTWVYLMGQLVLMGALLNRMLRDERRSAPAVPRLEDATPVAVAEDREPAGIEVGEAGG